jgi:uncharacterized protein YacL
VFNIDIKKIIKFLTSAILCFIVGLFFKNLYKTWVWTLIGGMLGAILGRYVLPFIADSLINFLSITNLILFRIFKRKSFIIESSAVLDGRIVELIKAGIIDRPIFISSVTIDELNRMKNLSDLYKNRVNKGMEAIDIIRKIKKNGFKIIEYSKQPKSTRDYILHIAKMMDASIITLDSSITEDGRKKKINVVNINELALAFRTQILPGEQFEVLINKFGKEPKQGIGYLEDGVMVVLEDGKDYINKKVLAECTSVLQSPSGKIIFGKYLKDAADF